MSTFNISKNPATVYLRSFMPPGTGKGRPIGCLVYSFDRESGEFYYGLSTHNPKDRFDRKIARTVALGRYRATPSVFRFYEKRDASLHDIFHDLAQKLSRDSHVPTRTRQAFANYLLTVQFDELQRKAIA